MEFRSNKYHAIFGTIELFFYLLLFCLAAVLFKIRYLGLSTIPVLIEATLIVGCVYIGWGHLMRAINHYGTIINNYFKNNNEKDKK